MAVFQSADILIPRNVDFTKWSVIACDQHTSEEEYWEEVKKITDGSPSSLNIIFPEVYLNDGRDEERIKSINAEMEKYMEAGIFREIKDSFIYVKRTLANGKVRRGIVGAFDLEEYDFSVGSQSKIRATEGTIVGRIPPRKRIRANAPLEVPHIIILADDRERTVVEPLEGMTSGFEKLYDFELMQNAGHIVGYRVDETAKRQTTAAAKRLGDRDAFEAKYGVKDKGTLMFAVGDGNHSLATAKVCWEEIKKGLTSAEAENHPARYALAELMNIHDETLEFESIQRAVFGVKPEELLSALVKYYGASDTDNGGQRIDYVYGESEGSLYIANPPSNLPIGTLQRFLDEYTEKNGGRVDYIHGNNVVRSLAKRENTVGFMVSPMGKSELFASVIKDGSLPRKTFSMGCAADKRFYLECKKIR